MNLRFKALSIALTFVTAAIAADISPDVRVGHLDNGLTYFIVHNENPAGTADYFLAQQVGSVNENEDQRGLAHFLEHMCFNGSEHYPGNSMITYLESIGVKFGAHLNAYTSSDETVYNISKAPTTRPSAVDSCLLVLRDWSCALTLSDEDINAERGVIESEWRHRNAASNRMLERAAPRLYGGSMYGERMPIGLMEVVRNFEPQTLRDFYDRWYIPANQAIIVAGDVDIDAIESSIIRMFGPIPAKRSDLSEVVSIIDVPDNDIFTPVSESDPEQGAEMLQLYFKINKPDNARQSDAIQGLVTTMLAKRYDELEASSDCPHTSLGLGEVKFFMTRWLKAYTLRGSVKAGRANDALKAWYREVRRAAEFGFTDDELAEAKKECLESLAERYRKHQSANNTFLARNISRYYLDGGDIISLEDAEKLSRQYIDQATADDCRQYISQFVNATGRNAVALNYRPKTERTNEEVEADFSRAFAEVTAETLQPTSTDISVKPLLDNEPNPGFITATDSLPLFDAKVYTLSNGIRIIAKKTDFKADQIYIRGFSNGGISQLYSPENAVTLREINQILPELTYSGRTPADIRRATASANIKISASIGNMEESIEAATGRRDMEDAFRLIYLRSTGAEEDAAGFDAFVERQRNSIANRRFSPTQAMGDSIHLNIYSSHPLAGRTTLNEIDQLSMDVALKTVHDRFGDMSDFTFMVVGDFVTDSLESALKKYIASLPGGGRVETPKDINYRYTPGEYNLIFEREMENPSSIVYKFYSGPVDYSLENVLAAQAFGQVLRTRLLADLREDRGWTYSIKSHASVNTGINGVDGPQMLMPVYVKVAPGHEEATAQIIDQTIADLANGSITDEEILGIREYYLKNHSEAIRDNAYWLSIIKAWIRTDMDLHTPYAATVESITPEIVAQFAREYILTGNRSTIIMKAK